MEVVAVQMNVAWEQPQRNFETVRRLLTPESVQPGSLVVLPEMFHCGFSMDTSRTAQGEAREAEAVLAELARTLDSAVLGGVVGPPREGTPPNEAVAFAPDGSELVRYRKLQPFTPSGELECYGRGDGHRLFSWQGMRVAPFICYDLRFPEVFRPAALDGAELLCVIASWPSARSEHWVRLLQARAIENQAYTVGVNRCGDDPQFHFDGRTCAFDPHGNSLAEADDSEQLVRVSISPDVVRQWREAFPALRDARR